MRIFFKRRENNLPRRRQVADDDSSKAELEYQKNTFQRNRTLAGSVSHYGSAISDMSKSPRTHIHYLALRRRKIGAIFMLVVAAGLVVFWLLSQFTAQVVISTSDISLSRAIDSKVYEELVDDYLDIRPLSRLRFMLDKKDLGNYITASRSEVYEVERISPGDIGQTSIALSMRRPVAGWTIDGKQYFVDDKGIAFEKNFYDNPSLQIVDNSGITPDQGAAVASNRFLSFVGRVVTLSKDRNYTVVQAIIPAGTTRQLEVQLQDIGSHVLFSIDRSVGEQVEDMAKVLQYFIAHGQSPTYIDVRVSGKAFYQ
jgi:hypothetical protein